jgi:hypothetical protein
MRLKLLGSMTDHLEIFSSVGRSTARGQAAIISDAIAKISNLAEVGTMKES